MPSFSARSVSPTPSPSPPIPTRPNSPLSNLTRHPNFYLPGGDLFIQIDTTLFAVHQYFFIRESSRWLHFLRNTTRGRTAREPIILIDEFSISPLPTVDDFATFLWVFYNLYYSYRDVPVRTWWTIEVYASYFQMRNVLDLVFRELNIIVQNHRASSTNWLSLSRLDGSNNPDDDEVPWNSSEEPYENWITNSDVVEEVSLILNRPHLLDGQDEQT